MRSRLIAIVIVLFTSGCANGGAAPSTAPTSAVVAATAPVPITSPTVTAATQTLPPSPTAPPAGLLAIIPTGNGPNELAATADAIWVENHRSNFLSRIDPAQNVEVAQLTSVPIHCDVAAGRGFVWATQASSGRATKVDPATNEVLGTISLDEACGVAADDTDVWVVSPGLGSVVRYDPVSDEERASVDLGAAPFVVAIGPEAVWVLGEDAGGTLWRVDPATNALVATIPVQVTFATGVEVGHDSVWVPARVHMAVHRIDPATDTVVASIPVPWAIGGLAVGPDAIWASGWGNGKIYRIDPETNEIVGSFSTGFGNLGPPLVAFDSLWVSAMDRNVVLRIDPAAVE